MAGKHSLFPELSRPLPTFDEWLEQHGDGSRGDGFAAFATLAAQTQDQNATGLAEFSEAAIFLRCWQGMSVAAVEIAEIERKRGTPQEIIIALLPRAMAAACMYSCASVLKDETPWSEIAEILAGDFAFAAKECARQLQERRSASSQPHNNQEPHA